MKGCVHRSGRACALGIDVRALVGSPALGWGLRVPCYTSSDSHDQAVCSSYRERTPEEVAARDAAIRDAAATALRILAGESVTCEKCGTEVQRADTGGGFVYGCSCGNLSGRSCGRGR